MELVPNNGMYEGIVMMSIHGPGIGSLLIYTSFAFFICIRQWRQAVHPACIIAIGEPPPLSEVAP